jgi:uncharacterized protein YfaT (DUF1175 family)
MRLHRNDGLRREEIDVAKPGSLAGQTLVFQEPDEVHVIIWARRIDVLHDAPRASALPLTTIY